MKQTETNSRRKARHLVAMIVLLFAAVFISTGCAVHASPYGVSVQSRVRLARVEPLPPPPPAVRHTCTSQRMCNIWGVCTTRTICAGH